MILTGRRNITKYLGLSWPTTVRLHREQGLPLVRLGGQWAVETDRIKQWMDKLHDEQTKTHTT